MVGRGCLPASKTHVASEALEGLYIGICTKPNGQRSALDSTRHIKLTGKNMSLQVLISGKRLAAVGTENHVGEPTW